MEAKIGNVNRNEILKYLSYRGNEIPPEIDEMIDSCIEEVKIKAQPKYMMKVFDIDKRDGRIFLSGTDFELPGKDIKNMLSDCDKCILIAVTMGVVIDNLLRQTKIRDLARSVVLDSTASATIESVINLINDELEEDYESRGKFLTDRFSPGYGDMDIAVQKDFLRVMDASRAIGLNVSSSGIMTPRKSVTAIIGIADIPQEKRFTGCENCRMFLNCELRKNGFLCRRVRES